jgi:RNA-splicing ligase RtcB
MNRGESMARHYRALLESEHTEGEHPADRLVADLPDVREVDQAARAMSAEMSRSVARRQSITSWTEYEDLRFQQRSVREERFFDVGYEMGWEAGIAQYSAFADGPDATVVRQQVHRALVSSDLSRIERAMVLLEVARALLRPANTGSDTSNAG